MYYPYLRGKQFELTLLRDNIELISENGIHPIIEPVRKDFKSILRTLEALHKKNIECTLIVNPQEGDKPEILKELIDGSLKGYNNIFLGIILDAKTQKEELLNILKKYKERNFTLIHYGYSNGKEIADSLKGFSNVKINVFIDGKAGKLYQTYFNEIGEIKILIRNGFKTQKKNALYPFNEHFSDLHITYEMEGMNGFGDFLIVGDEYSETGGPAYAVAIHLTYLNKADKDMYIYHFISDQTDSPTDPGGKFLEALSKLAKELQKANTSIFRSKACEIYLDLYKKKHYPGLGLVKKLSMQHHIELIANYLKEKNK